VNVDNDDVLHPGQPGYGPMGAVQPPLDHRGAIPPIPHEPAWWDDYQKLSRAPGEGQHDPLVCGLGYDTDCDACRRAAYRIALAHRAPGQPGTLAEQLALATTPRPTPEQARRAEISEIVEEVLRRVLVEELGEAIEYYLTRRKENAA
jgi:hypothetical protein